MYAKRGIIVRLLYLLGALLCWIATGLGRLRRGGAVVLCYHNVTEAQRTRFARQMKHIVARAIRCRELQAEDKRGQPQVCVTFDDAFASLLDNALPTLEACGIPAMIFAVSGNCGDQPRWRMSAEHPDRLEPTMPAATLKAIDRRPLVSVESHTHTHQRLTTISDSMLFSELAKSRSRLEELLGRSVHHLALPFGACDAKVLEAARHAGYTQVYTLEAKVSKSSRAGRGEGIGRFSVSPDMWHLEFALTAAGAYGWLHAWRSLWKKLRRPNRAAHDPHLIVEVAS